jgi:hypothetical protein
MKPPGAGFAGRAAVPLAVLFALVFLGGILLPSTYARETANWAAQAIVQDYHPRQSGCTEAA